MTEMTEVDHLRAALLVELQVLEEFGVAVVDKHLASNRPILSLPLVVHMLSLESLAAHTVLAAWRPLERPIEADLNMVWYPWPLVRHLLFLLDELCLLGYLIPRSCLA